ncbi:MAG: hypothetical protein WAS72_03780, partial [Saprospiraceae bacterium]
MKPNDEGVFFLNEFSNSSENLFVIYGEKQGFYKEKFNGKTVEMVALFSKFLGKNSFYKAIGVPYNQAALDK